ncbi:OLC1v1005970C1 [Oldenlandia corymbosa var. corymbosa]|uniref:OLC1v1005970C1 n=1 Tax=Oldenlandia corymbosa var. corymbosa TaxID=529605 RepID=A0AAV1DIB8_OLDCO|nr:OLC1v1005970C1 [Oldenlandia corymbosa var. corymbosa]
MAMAFSPKIQFLLFISLYLIPLSISHEASALTDVHDLFPKYNLPKGLLPDNVKSYSLSSVDSSFKIELTHQCYVQFKDQLVLYDTTITGKLYFGKVSDVSGIHARRFFIWVPVTGMDVDEVDNMIEFHVGFLSQKLPVDDFQIIPTCLDKKLQDSLLASE